jgi:hypothetical protein
LIGHLVSIGDAGAEGSTEGVVSPGDRMGTSTRAEQEMRSPAVAAMVHALRARRWSAAEAPDPEPLIDP